MTSVWIRVVVSAALLEASGSSGMAADNVRGGLPAGADAQSREDADARVIFAQRELTDSILAQRERASGRPFSPQLRGSLARKLLPSTSEQLQAFHDAGGLGDIDTLVRAAEGPRFLGAPAADLVFTPVSPCRIINTTLAGGIINPGVNRSFYVSGSTAGTFENQGGKAGGCGIPDTATAVEMNLVAVAPAGPGDFRAFPYSAAPTAPLASVINYSNVAGLNIANGLAQPVCNPATTTCTFDLVVQADVAPAHLVVDVVGYYTPATNAVTVLWYDGSNGDNTIGNFEQFRVVGNFTKQAASTAITTTWNAHVNTVGTVGVSFCHYQVRIDGNLPVGAAPFSGVVNYGGHQAVSLTTYWSGLAAGVHSVSIWVRGAATACQANQGDFDQSVMVTEH